ncbi:MAG: VOC family protein [Acidobacteria bacterium]|nr:VOC family protein [Acidobacteriota bacterium]
MLGLYDIVAFVLTSDAARAKTFYGETLGLKYVSQDDYAVVFEANGVMLRVTRMPGHTPAKNTVLGWNVPDIAVAAADLTKAGVKFEKYSFLEQDELGIWSSPDGTAKVAWFKDPDGNVLSISQH